MADRTKSTNSVKKTELLKKKNENNTKANTQKSLKYFFFKDKKSNFSGKKKFLADKISASFYDSNNTSHNPISEKETSQIHKLSTEKSNEIGLESPNSAQACAQEKSPLQTEDSVTKRSTEKDLRNAKMLLKKTGALNLQKDLQIQQLKDQLRALQPEDVGDTNHLSNPEGKFTTDDLKIIRSVGPGASKDSNFVLKVMRALYNGAEKTKLHERSAAGKKHKGAIKSGITPEKRKIVEEMLLKRISNEVGIEEAEFEKRFKLLNRFMRSAIHNIKTSLRKENNPENIEPHNEPEDTREQPINQSSTEIQLQLNQRSNESVHIQQFSPIRPNTFHTHYSYGTPPTPYQFQPYQYQPYQFQPYQFQQPLSQYPQQHYHSSCQPEHPQNANFNSSFHDYH